MIREKEHIRRWENSYNIHTGQVILKIKLNKEILNKVK